MELACPVYPGGPIPLGETAMSSVKAPRRIVFIYDTEEQAEKAFKRLQEQSRRVSFVVNPGDDIRIACYGGYSNAVEIDAE